MLIPLHDLLLWARAIVRTIEDMGQEGTIVYEEAQKLLREIKCELATPSQDHSFAAGWIRCTAPQLQTWADGCKRNGKPERARMYEAIVAVRLSAAETIAGQ